MKQILPAALLAAVASSALTLLLSAGIRRPPAPATAAEFKSALADLVGEVAALRKDLAAERKAAAVPAPAPAPAIAAAPAPAAPAAPAPGELVLLPDPPAEEVPAMEEFAPPKERSAIARSAELVERIRGLTKWDDSAEVRSRWILASEETIVNTFGKPDEIWIQDGGSENWTFRTLTGTRDEEGDPEWQDIILTLNRGRLVRVDG